MPSRCSLTGLAVLLVVLTGLAGCVASPPTGSDSGDRKGTLSSEVLGNPRTVDPCGLVGPERLNRFGAVSRAGTVSLDYCLLHVRPEPDQLVQLAVGRLRYVDPEQLTSGNPVRRSGGLRLVREAPVPEHCTWRILFSDGVALSVDADSLSGRSSVGLCSLAEAGVRAAAETIRQREVEHRSFPEGSLALTDPCELLSTETVRRVPGLERAEPRDTPSRHKCTWGGGSIRVPSVELTHTAGEPPRSRDATSVTERTAGRRTVTDIVGDDPKVGLCSAETGHIPFGPPRSGEVEVVMLVVFLPEADGLRACEFARGLAEHVWPRLPER
ncbi:DUF3558 domain-containing protein [Actinopolyspora saharensis]|uniref:DUF3558 domain-containing protein n=1 Tax=Actinopolyspora saharensis TaxID=995062 RepID=A0A1H1DU70_9ACTN|nr:DUF3558 domain-containing protein [Actinopolyspora saharensis]SDQ80035.1 hypothetical protein SAMN04489718_2238 [Actinopolyspora saharensis]